MVTVMGIAARARQFDLTGTQVSVVKEMTQQRPRRISRLSASVTFPVSVTEVVQQPFREELQTIAENCPVRLSLLPAIDVPMTFTWG